MTKDLRGKVGVGTTHVASPSNGTAPPTAPEEVSIQVALARVMAEVRAVTKDGFHDAPGAKFNFRGIDGVMNAVGPAMRNHGVIPLPSVEHIQYRDVKTSGGKDAREVTVQVRYTFLGPAGDSLEVLVPGEAMDNGDKGTAKAMSVAFRVALLQTLAIPTHEPDPDSYGYERAAAQPTPVEEARAKLIATMQRLQLDPVQVINAFNRREGMDPRQCEDPALLYGFAAELEGDSDAALGVDPQAAAAKDDTDEPDGQQVPGQDTVT